MFPKHPLTITNIQYEELKTQILEFKKLVENSCSLYNEVAMNAIQQNFESNK